MLTTWHHALRRQWLLEAIKPLTNPGFGARVVSVVIPGYAYCIYGRRVLGWAMLALYGIATLFFLRWLGQFVADVAMGVMMSLHSVSLYYLMGRRPTLPNLRWRLFLALSVVVGVSALWYLPLRLYLENRWFMPLTVDGQVVIVDVRRSARQVQRGDRIAFRYSALAAGNVLLESGYGMGVIEAIPGEEVIFGKGQYLAAGLTKERRPLMPQSGRWWVPENHWFLWPDSSIKLAGDPVGALRTNAAYASNVMQVLRHAALVPQTNVLGTPFKRWFGREQVEP